MENMELNTHEIIAVNSFCVPTDRADGRYLLTCSSGHFVGFCTAVEGSSCKLYCLGHDEEDLLGDNFVVDPACFATYYPTAEDVERWTSEAHPLEQIVKDAVRQAWDKLCAEQKTAPVRPTAAPFPTVDDPKEREAIYEEMISKVDMKRFKVFASMAANREDDFKRIFINKEVANKYLRGWAMSKYRIYLAFGRNLKLETDYEAERNVDQFISALRMLASRYERYALTLCSIIDNASHAQLMQNELNANYYLREVLPTLSAKGKVTTLCHALFEDNKFDAELGYLYQDTRLKKKLAISIDPLDFLTMSENKHNWESCHNLHGGCYGGGSFCYMTDPSTAIAYMYDGYSEYEYNRGKLKSKWNSKEWRQCVYMSADSGSAIFSRQYPRENENVCKAVRSLYEATVMPNVTWGLRHNELPCTYSDDFHMAYHDVLEDYSYSSIRIDRNDRTTMHVGGPVYCIHCGEEIETLSGDGHCRVLCHDCTRALTRDNDATAVTFAA